MEQRSAARMAKNHRRLKNRRRALARQRRRSPKINKSEKSVNGTIKSDRSAGTVSEKSEKPESTGRQDRQAHLPQTFLHERSQARGRGRRAVFPSSQEQQPVQGEDRRLIRAAARTLTSSPRSCSILYALKNTAYQTARSSRSDS